MTLAGKPSDPYHLEIWNMDKSSSAPRVRDAWASNLIGACELLTTWAQKDEHYRLKLYFHPTESRGYRILVGQYDKAGVITDPEGEFEPSKKDIGFEFGHLLKNSGDGIGEAFAAFLENQAQGDGPGFEPPNLDGLGEGLGALIGGIFEGLGNG